MGGGVQTQSAIDKRMMIHTRTDANIGTYCMNMHTEQHYGVISKISLLMDIYIHTCASHAHAETS